MLVILKDGYPDGLVRGHAYFVAPDLKDPLRSAKEWLRREAHSNDFNLKGNKVWSCTLVEEPKDPGGLNALHSIVGE